MPALAAADAPDVTSASGSVVYVDPSTGAVTIEVHGTWAWPTHTSDCNVDRAGAGVAIDWGDFQPSPPAPANTPNGFHVTDLNFDSIDVGVAVLDPSVNNPVENLVHPAEPVPGNPGDITANSPATWRGNCGEFKTGPLLPAPKKYPQGSFGTYLDINRAETTGPVAGVPGGTGTHFLVHTYPDGNIPQICALTYDVHGKNNSHTPNNQNEITGGGGSRNKDNSAEKNASHTVGNVCFQIHISNVTTDAGPSVSSGTAITDSATLTGTIQNANPADPIGHIEWNLYGPSDPGDCSSAALATYTLDVTGNGTYSSDDASASPANTGYDTTGNDGTYRWVANFISNDPSKNSSTANGCNGLNENVVVGYGLSTTPSASQVPVGTQFTDQATLAGSNGTADGTLTFNLYDNDTCTGPVVATEAFDLGTLVPNASGEYVVTTTVDTSGLAAGTTYYWVATYANDSTGNADIAATAATCADTSESVAVEPGTTALSTKAVNAATVGDTVTDTATLTQVTGSVTPAGDITFALYDASCNLVQGGIAAKNAVTAEGDYDSVDFDTTGLAPGTYHWGAEFVSSDANNGGSSSACSAADPDETLALAAPPCKVNCNPNTPEPPKRNPAISIDKTGPATAQAGSTVAYLIVVTNTGDQSFPEANLALSDPVCGATPQLVQPDGKNGDQTSGTLDPGESWFYTCSVATALGQTNVHNVASVTGIDAAGDPPVSDDDPADTVLVQPTQAVLPLLPGSARLRGPAGCLAGGPHKLVVTGRRIKTVTFFLDGKKVATKTKADSHGRFTYTVNRKHLRTGIHRIVARVTYLPETTGGRKTFRRTFAKCARALRPEFTG